MSDQIECSMRPMDAQGLEVYVQQPERRLGLMARLLGHAAHHHLRGAGLLSFLHSQLASSYGAYAHTVVALIHVGTHSSWSDLAAAD